MDIFALYAYIRRFKTTRRLLWAKKTEKGWKSWKTQTSADQSKLCDELTSFENLYSP